MVPETLTLLVGLITLMFILSGFSKLSNIIGMATGLANKLPSLVSLGIPSEIFQLAILVAALLQVVGPGIMLYEAQYKQTGQRSYSKYAALALAGFSVLATLVYHFPPVGSTYYPFISNVTTVGGLLLTAYIM